MAYIIRETRTFYGPRKEKSLVSYENGTTREFDSRKAAQTWIDSKDAEVYHEAHNECERPAYRIIRTIAADA